MYIADWEPLIKAILVDVNAGKEKSGISAKFHITLANIILAIAEQTNEKRVVLSGGCFQNKYLLESTIKLLRQKRFKPYWHQRVPPNDGGISLGQIAAVSKILNKE